MDENSLYERDERLWMLEQIKALKDDRISELDFPNLREHLQCQVIHQQHELRWAVKDICWKLMELEFADISPKEILELQSEILTLRNAAERHFEFTPSILDDYLVPRLPKIWASALRLANYQGPFAPPVKPYTLEQITDFDWYPDFYSRPPHKP